MRGVPTAQPLLSSSIFKYKNSRTGLPSVKKSAISEPHPPVFNEPKLHSNTTQTDTAPQTLKATRKQPATVMQATIRPAAVQASSPWKASSAPEQSELNHPKSPSNNRSVHKPITEQNMTEEPSERTPPTITTVTKLTTTPLPPGRPN